MKKFVTIMISIFAVVNVEASETIVLETLWPESMDTFNTSYGGVSCYVSKAGEVVTLTTVAAEGWYPKYTLKYYSQYSPAVAWRMGEFWYMGGWYRPGFCGFEGDRLLFQEDLVDDIPPLTCRLKSIDLTGSTNMAVQYVGDIGNYSINRIWKTDSTHASSFVKSWTQDGFMLDFISNYDLYPRFMDADSIEPMTGDTLLSIERIYRYSAAKLEGQNTYFALYQQQNATDYQGVLVESDSSITFLDSIITENLAIYRLQAHNGLFHVFYQVSGTQEIWRWTFNATTHESTRDLVYSAYEGGNEYFGGLKSVIMNEDIAFQIAILKDSTSYGVDNWYGVVTKQISQSDYSVNSIDTVFLFEDGTNFVRTSIASDGNLVHNVVAAKTPEYSRVYYYGPNQLVGIEPDHNIQPDQFQISNIYPNPCNGRITISFTQQTMSKSLTLSIYDILGKLCWNTTVFGSNSVAWDSIDNTGKSVASGTYIAVLSNGNTTSSHKLVIIK